MQAPQGYMSLEYDVVQGYCSSGFPIKYAYSNYSQYNRTINVALLFYYYAIRSEEHEFTKDEYERMFGTFFLDEKVLNDLKNNKELSSRCLADVEEKLRKKSLSGCWQERFEENWRKKRPQFLENQIVKGQIIRDNFMPVEEFDKLADQGATLKRAINFLDKLTTESHDRCSDNDVVLVPYKEYHALHELLLENPREKESLEEKHAKMVHRLERIFSRQVKKSN